MTWDRGAVEALGGPGPINLEATIAAVSSMSAELTVVPPKLMDLKTRAHDQDRYVAGGWATTYGTDHGSVVMHRGTDTCVRPYFNQYADWFDMCFAFPAGIIGQSGSATTQIWGIDSFGTMSGVSNPFSTATATPTTQQGEIHVWDPPSGQSAFVSNDGSDPIVIWEGFSQTVLSTHVDVKARLAVMDLHGGLSVIVLGDTISSIDPITDTSGIGKLVLVVNAGADTEGSITVTGTSVDRETGAETGADTESVTISGTTTDASTTDANSQEVVDFSNAYMTSKWWRGSFTLTTSDVDISDVDIYMIAFEQFNDNPVVKITTQDITALATNTNAWVSAHLYSVVTGTGNTVTIESISSLVRTSADIDADKFYRMREGNIDLDVDGSSDGIFVQLFLGPLASTYWEDISHKVWANTGNVN